MAQWQLVAWKIRVTKQPVIGYNGYILPEPSSGSPRKRLRFRTYRQCHK